jgi:exopolysaccharide biosynthesis WecB/TagA/CpsF family protein
MTVPVTPFRIVLGGAVVDLWREDRFVAVVRNRLGGRQSAAPLAVSSANLDHIHHFGTSGTSIAIVDIAGASPKWVVLLDGIPLVRRAARLTAHSWPRLAGSDLLPAILTTAENAGATAGFLGGTTEMHGRLAVVLAERFPALKIAGLWSPSREELGDPSRAAALADTIRSAKVDLLVVGLGKPRQEQWIQQYAEASGARVLLGFGAAADFLAGMVNRAPTWMRQAGLEWVYRLFKEPRRLGRRYCLEAPPALWRLWRYSILPAGSMTASVTGIGAAPSEEAPS